MTLHMFERNGALFGPDNRPTAPYRYHLWREWGPSRLRCVWIMLNPSTANAEDNDPTIRRCIGFARRWGCGAIDCLNLFALVSSDPRALLVADDAVGIENDSTIERVVDDRFVDHVVVAWGAFPIARQRAARVLDLLNELGVEPECLGVTSTGAPRHPLYVPGAAELRPFVVARHGGSP